MSDLLEGFCCADRLRSTGGQGQDRCSGAGGVSKQLENSARLKSGTLQVWEESERYSRAVSLLSVMAEKLVWSRREVELLNLHPVLWSRQLSPSRYRH